jgi:hypothetical protein
VTALSPERNASKPARRAALRGQTGELDKWFIHARWDQHNHRTGRLMVDWGLDTRRQSLTFPIKPPAAY